MSLRRSRRRGATPIEASLAPVGDVVALGSQAEQLPSVDSVLGWLADAPLFLDAEQIHALYDAVIRPEAGQGTVEITLSSVTRATASSTAAALT